MLRTACTLVLLVVLAGCTSSGDEAGDPPGKKASTAAPQTGVCRVLTPSDVAADSNADPEVPCTSRHTAETFAAGTFPAGVAAGGPDGKALGAYVFRRCRSGFRRFVGATDSLALRSTLTWAWFRPSTAAWAAGAHTWRCDVVAGDERAASLGVLPRTVKGVLLGKPDDRWLTCVDAAAVTGSPRIPCSSPHTWRAVTTIVLGAPTDPYPGDRLSEVRTRDYCSDSVGAWMNYPLDYDYGYTWFHAAEWGTGNRRAVCWARTDQ